MKKVSLFAALLLMAVGSWSFYPKTADESLYMMLTLRIQAGSRPELVTIAPDGTESLQPLDYKKKATNSVKAQALLKLNQLKGQGWSVVQMTSFGEQVRDPNHPLMSPDQTLTETYLLEKR